MLKLIFVVFAVLMTADGGLFDLKLDLGALIGQKCCGLLGCFNLLTSLLPLPQCPEEMSIDMRVFTREDRVDGKPIDRNTIPSTFKPGVLTMIIVHGWLQSQSVDWMHAMKDAALRRGDYNVIIVGWSGGAKLLWYPQSAANTRTVGYEVSLVVNNTILRGGQKREQVHCVGHSLGAHVCGNAGNRLKLGRISGLDPAGPLFELIPMSNGLSKDSADFVDIIHTNGLGLSFFHLGTVRSLGHVDFFPNGGGSQPGCLMDPFAVFSIDAFVGFGVDQILNLDPSFTCSHGRAYEYFTESIDTPCFSSRGNCNSYFFKSLLCSTSGPVTQSMGFDADKYYAKGDFYLVTNSASPYCTN